MSPLGSPLRFAVIGTKHPHSSMFQESLLQTPGVKVVALLDDGGRINPALADATVHTDVSSLLERPDLDAALITVPNDEGMDVAVAVANAHLPFLIDKPVCRNASEMRVVVEAVAATGVQCATGYLNRFRPTQLRARSIVRSPEFGKVRAVEGHLFATDITSRGQQPFLFQLERSGGGVLHWLGCHVIDAVRDLVGGELSAVRASLSESNHPGIDVEEVGVLTFSLEGGAVGSITAGYVIPHESEAPYEHSPKESQISVWGSKARLVYEPLGDNITITWFDPVPGTPASEHYRLPQRFEPGYGGPLGRLLIEELIASIREGRKPLVNELDNLQVLKVLDAVYGADA